MIDEIFLSRIYLSFLLLDFLVFLISSAILVFHWRRYNYGSAVIRAAFPIYFVGALAALGAAIAGFILIT